MEKRSPRVVKMDFDKTGFLKKLDMVLTVDFLSLFKFTTLLGRRNLI